MPTEASLRALQGMRDLSALKWYVIPLLALVFYVYTAEIKKARASGNWDAIFAGLTIFGVDFINETINGWIFHLTQRSALWTAPGPTALRTMVGWNIEIMFMFAISGIIFWNSFSGEKGKKILEPIPFMSELIPGTLCHHEAYDGSGYPQGLAGEDIPLLGRIIAVGDTYDAMTSDRAYRRALPHQVAVDELISCSGTQFDKELVEIFLKKIEIYRDDRLAEGREIPK